MSTPYAERVVAFLDILGFRAHVARLGKDAALRKKIHRALAEIRVFKHASLRNETAQRDLEVSVFSDSIAISGERTALGTIAWTALGVQSQLLGLGILVRGGISLGPTFHADDMLYGEGLVRAYDLEQNAAIYPRIVLDPVLITPDEAGLCATLLSKDSDGLWFIDPFAMGGLAEGTEALLEDGWDPQTIYLEEVGRIIAQRLAELTDARQRAKWGWLEPRHAAAVKEYATHKMPRVFRLMQQAREKGVDPQSTRMTIELGPAKKPSHAWTD